jgi:hypothetical protein
MGEFDLITSFNAITRKHQAEVEKETIRKQEFEALFDYVETLIKIKVLQAQNLDPKSRFDRRDRTATACHDNFSCHFMSMCKQDTNKQARLDFIFQSVSNFSATANIQLKSLFKKTNTKKQFITNPKTMTAAPKIEEEEESRIRAGLIKTLLINGDTLDKVYEQLDPKP